MDTTETSRIFVYLYDPDELCVVCEGSGLHPRTEARCNACDATGVTRWQFTLEKLAERLKPLLAKKEEEAR